MQLVLPWPSRSIMQSHTTPDLAPLIAQAQVVNRDMSVAVLRYFVEQRQRELEEGTFKNRKGRLAMAAAKAADGAESNGAPAQPVSFSVLMVPGRSSSCHTP